MAIQELFGASWGDGAVTLSVTMDDVTLRLQQLVYTNDTDQPAALVMEGPIARTITGPPQKSVAIDLTSANVVLTPRTAIDKQGNPYTAYDLPGGEQLSFRWPAA